MGFEERERSAPELAAFQIKPHPGLFCNFPLPGSDDMTTTMVITTTMMMIAMMMLMMTPVTMAMMMLTIYI